MPADDFCKAGLSYLVTKGKSLRFSEPMARCLLHHLSTLPACILQVPHHLTAISFTWSSGPALPKAHSAAT